MEPNGSPQQTPETLVDFNATTHSIPQTSDLSTPESTDDTHFSKEGKFSIEAKKFADDIDEWSRSGYAKGEYFILGNTGEVLQGLGAIDNPIYMSGDKILRILDDHREITLQEIKSIPKIVENPYLILKSHGNGVNTNTRLVIFGSVKAGNGNPVLAVLDLRPFEGRLYIDGYQKINSIYTKTTSPAKFIQKSEVVYAEKNKAIKVLRTLGLHLGPNELTHDGFVGSISYIGQKVNISGKKFSEIFSTDDTNFSKDIGRTYTEGEVQKIIANLSHEKVYTRTDASAITDKIIRENIADVMAEDAMGDEVYALRGKSREEVTNKLWVELNRAQPGKRAGMANTIAEYIINHAVIEASKEQGLSAFGGKPLLRLEYSRNIRRNGFRFWDRHWDQGRISWLCVSQRI